ncbi:MAG: HAMP domain-containing histidine kinase [Candidatus Gastranaerophilales bacterium]|nr:HAMP domain-containing histidine kinase [Candidatus Gastranaerophilales bacterium]
MKRRRRLKIFKPHRLKIVEQVIVVALFSIIIPLIVTGIIVNNINRQALTRELGKLNQNLAETVDENIYGMYESDNAKIKDIAVFIKYLNNDNIDKYLTSVSKNSNVFSSLKIEKHSKNNLPIYIKNAPYLNPETREVTVVEPLGNDKFLVGIMKNDYTLQQVFKNINDNIRQIFVLSESGKLLFSLNYNDKDFQEIYNILPDNVAPGISAYIGEKENQPVVYRKMQWSGIVIIVNTPEVIVENSVYTPAWKIFIAMLVSSIASILFISLYVYYLYINIRQLFKGIIALTKGNYSRKIRLLKNILTPYEIVFLANEFNKAADEINLSYSKLAQQNKELEIMDKFRSNLIDTVSHEFRTPLTSIQGYTSRLMRHDIKIDEATLNKSLKIIKRQSERLSRMVEDLLVIPDIEGSKIALNKEPVNVADALEITLLSVKNIENREVINNASDKEIYVYADKDRFEQILINLIENANKYGIEGTPLTIDMIKVKNKVTIIMKNYAEYIDKNTVKKLFEKFVRLDDQTTRTTRGTGLGLYIVKGLLQAMNGNIFIKSTQNNEFYTYVVLPAGEEE